MFVREWIGAILTLCFSLYLLYFAFTNIIGHTMRLISYLVFSFGVSNIVLVSVCLLLSTIPNDKGAGYLCWIGDGIHGISIFLVYAFLVAK